MSNVIYRVFDRKDKYQQSYSPKLQDSYSWAVSCADLVKGFVRKDVLNDKGLTESSAVVYPKNTDGN